MNGVPCSDRPNEEHGVGSEEFWTLSGKKPFRDVILSRTHLRPRYRLNVPAKMHQVLPSATTPLVLEYKKREWDMIYQGKSKTLDYAWRRFADDNNLKIGDACVFELKECSHKKIVFRTQILRGDIPHEMLLKIVDAGKRKDCPIIIS